MPLGTRWSARCDPATCVGRYGTCQCRVLGRQVSRHFCKARALRDSVPGLLRASALVLFHFYVWAAFWQLSGGKRTPEDDRLLRRVAVVLEAFRRTGRLAGAPVRALRALRGGARR